MQIDRDLAEAHVALIRECGDPGLIEYRVIGEKTHRHYDFKSLDRDLNGRRVFVGICPRVERWTNQYRKSSLFFVDLDNAQGDDLTLVDETLEACEAAGIEPREIVHSGNGLHVYFVADKLMTKETRRATVKHYSKLLKKHNAPGEPDSAVCDMGRVVGLWGSFNSKRGRMVTPVYTNPEALKVRAKYATPDPIRVYESGLKEWRDNMNPHVYSMHYLRLYSDVIPNFWDKTSVRTLLSQAASETAEQHGDKEEAEKAFNIIWSQKQLRLTEDRKWAPKPGGRRKWAYHRLALAVEAFPSKRQLSRFALAMLGDMHDWVMQEPGQIEDIVESLVKERLK